MPHKTETKDRENNEGTKRKEGENSRQRQCDTYTHRLSSVVQLKMHTQIQFEAADKKSHMHKTLTEYNTHILAQRSNRRNTHGTAQHSPAVWPCVCWGLLFITFSFSTLFSFTLTHTQRNTVSHSLTHSLMHMYTVHARIHARINYIVCVCPPSHSVWRVSFLFLSSVRKCMYVCLRAFARYRSL